jgi:uncharacterized phage infection (PIP) family protein YhgE
MTKRNWNRIAFIVIAWTVALILLAVAISSGNLENCWDKYQTEDEAIMNCESHE